MIGKFEDAMDRVADEILDAERARGLSFTLPAGDRNRFAQAAADSLIGRQMVVKNPVTGVGLTYTVTSVELTDTGDLSIGCTPPAWLGVPGCGHSTCAGIAYCAEREPGDDR